LIDIILLKWLILN